MKSNLSPETDRGTIDAILSGEEELIPSSGFWAATMERVRKGQERIYSLDEVGARSWSGGLG